MAEREKWGRIPATLWEVDQAICKLRWGTAPCPAGPEANLIAFSTDVTVPYWVNEGSRAVAGGRDGVSDSVFLLRDGAQTLSYRTEAIQSPATPKMNKGPVLYLSVEFKNVTGVTAQYRVEMSLYGNGAILSQKAVFLRASDGVVVFAESGVLDPTVTALPDGWKRLQFGVDTATAVSSSELFVAFPTISGWSGDGGQAQFAQFSISPNFSDDYYRTDGEAKLAAEPCFNTLSTCQALASYDPSGAPLTLRFSEHHKSSRLPATLGAIPSLIQAKNKPAELSVGGTNESISPLGSRDELTAVFQDHPHSDFLVDPYRDMRPYNPEEQGTFWGKWEARNVYRQGLPVRKISGYELEDGTFEVAHTYNYLLERVEGPDPKGRFTVRAYDILQALRADQAVFPAASPGRLSSDLQEGDTFLTLQPVGVGDEYPAEPLGLLDGVFKVRIGGEGFRVQRIGDVLDIVERGLYGGLESHSEDDTVQVVAEFKTERIHDVAYDIITGALPSLAGNIPKAKWDAVAADFLPRLYSADITEPTGVEDLLAELTRTAPIYFYGDVRSNTIEMEVIRKPSQTAIELTEHEALIAGTVDVKEYPKERIDEVWVYYRIRDAAGDEDEAENYSQRFILVNPEEQARRGRRSIKRIFTRWIVAGARDTAEEIANAYISRFQNPPVRVSFDLDARRADMWLGDVAKLVSRQKQDVYGGARRDLNYQVIRAQELKDGHQFRYIAQSYEFFDGGIVDGGGGGVDDITITIQPEDTVSSGAVDQIDLRQLYDAAVATEIPNITFVVAGGPLPIGGAVVGAASGQTWSLRNPDNWPWSPSISFRVEAGGAVGGRGGQGGRGALCGRNSAGTSSWYISQAAPGGAGLPGFLVRYPTTINNLGIIAGGGGGGGGSGSNANATPTGGTAGAGNGGGGAGKVPGVGGAALPEAPAGQNGTLQTGGNGSTRSSGAFRGGKGGALGATGGSGETTNGGAFPGSFGAAGGPPGAGIDGIAFVTYTARGDIRGGEV